MKTFISDYEGLKIEPLEVDIAPVQDLNGYDNPWPGGAGRNKLVMSLAADYTINSNGMVGKYNGDGTFTFTSINATVEPVFVFNTDMANGGTTATQNQNKKTLPNGKYKIVFADNSPSGIGIQVVVSNNASTANGRVILASGHSGEFTIDDTYAYNWIRLICNIGVTAKNLTLRPMLLLADETDETFEPYANVCPITGWGGANVTRVGKNLFANVEAGYINVNGNKAAPSAPYNEKMTGYVPLSGNNIAFSFFNDTAIQGWGRLAVFDKNKNFLGVVDTNLAVGSEGKAIIPTRYNGAAYARLCASTFDTAKIQFEFGSEVTTYEEPQANTYPITFTSAGTVYGGTLDVASGVLTATHASYTFDGSETFIVNEGGNTNLIQCDTMTLPNRMMAGTWYTDEKTLCSRLPKSEKSTDFGIRFGANSRFIYFYQILKVLGISTLDDWKTWIASNNVQVTYPLYEPLTYQLTPTEVSTLLGQNTVWADTGEVTIGGQYHWNTETFMLDGKVSGSWGVGLSGTGVYNAPARKGEQIAIPGRNGDIFVDDGAWDNTDVVYPCWMASGFSDKVDDFRAYMAAHSDQYYRLVDTYHPDEYRLARFAGEFIADPGTRNLTGRMDIAFNCSPCRYLTSGEKESTLFDLKTGAEGSATITNPTLYTARPTLHIKKMNIGTITFANGVTMRVTGGNAIEDIYVDCEKMVIMDSNGDPTYVSNLAFSDRPGLIPGVNNITQTAAAVDALQIDITPRWYTL